MHGPAPTCSPFPCFPPALPWECPPSPQMFLRQLLNSLEVLRDAGIIHCDLKPENILLVNSQVGSALHVDWVHIRALNTQALTYHHHSLPSL